MSRVEHIGDAMEIVEEKREAATEPAKRWRNRYRLHEQRGNLAAGDHWGAYTWPTKDIAETKAAVEMPKRNSTYLLEVIQYLGAFPADEAP